VTAGDAGVMVGQPAAQAHRRHRRREEVALGRIAPGGHQLRVLLRRLDAFRQRTQPKFPTEPQEGVDEGPGGMVGVGKVSPG